MSIKGKLKGFASGIKRAFKVAGAGMFGVYIVTQVDAFKEQGYFQKGSEARQSFQRKTGVPLYGLVQDIECNPNTMELLSQTFNHYDKDMMPPSATSVNIVPANFFQKTFGQQIASVHDFGGYYNPLSCSVSLTSKGIDERVLNHELGHARMQLASGHDSKLMSKWKDLAKDDTGKSMYKPTLKTLLGRFNRDSSLESFRDDSDNKGFVSDYAKTSFDEDVAETISLAVRSPAQFLRLNNDFLNNSRLRGKVELLQNTNLIPRETVDYIAVEDNYVRWASPEALRHRFSREAPVRFYESAKNFLANHPHSRYASEVNTKLDSVKNTGSVVDYLARNKSTDIKTPSHTN